VRQEITRTTFHCSLINSLVSVCTLTPPTSASTSHRPHRPRRPPPPSDACGEARRSCKHTQDNMILSSCTTLLRTECFKHSELTQDKLFIDSTVDGRLKPNFIADKLKEVLNNYEYEHGGSLYRLSHEHKRAAVNRFQRYVNDNVSSLATKIRESNYAKPNQGDRLSRRFWGNIRNSVHILMGEVNAREYEKLKATLLIGPRKRPKRVTFGDTTVKEFHSEDWAVETIQRATRKRHCVKTKAVFLITRAMRALAKRKEEERKEEERKEEERKKAAKKKRKFAGAPHMSKRRRKK